MGVIVNYDYSAFVAQYPEFAYLNTTQVQTYWTMATLYQRNDGGGPVVLASQQMLLLNMLAAHFCALFAPTAAGGAASPIVGRINSTTQGSVSVGAEMPNQPQSAAFYQQTRYGAAWWAATAPFRTMRYLPGPGSRPLPAGPWWGGIGGFR